jgi:hypothetical protein
MFLQKEKNILGQLLGVNNLKRGRKNEVSCKKMPNMKKYLLMRKYWGHM